MLAEEFHGMLVKHGLKKKVHQRDVLPFYLLNANQILLFTADNATSNDKQTDYLSGLSNSFEELNQVRCFNHTIQLLAKALLKPFYSPGLMGKDDETDDGVVLQAMDDEEEKEEEDKMDDEDKEEEEDPFGAMDDDKGEGLIKNTEAVRIMLMKVSF